MARIIIGAGAGYFLGLFFVALSSSGLSFQSVLFRNAATFNASLMLACVAVGAVMGWAWHTIAVDAGSKDD
ncbi:hypothetical protein OAD38_02360 [Ascidiaceihabitans sp.]|nr:hypothetical protein [Ascidiaceihabitans sp.]